MPSSYQLVFRVSFEHGFFDGAALRSMRCVPAAASFDMLRRAGLLLRAEDDGIAAFGNQAAIERLRLHIAEAGTSLKLAFLVFSSDPHFFEYTVPAWPKGQVLLLDTADATLDAGGRQMLHATPCVPASAFVDCSHAGLAPILGRKVLVPAPAMVLQVALSDSLAGTPDSAADSAADSARRHFHARFGAASSHWKYCLFGAGAATARIVDLAGDMEFDRFAGVEVAAGRYADVFISKRAIEMRKSSAERFQLRAASPAGDKVLIKRLPNASLGKRVRENRDGNDILVSEIFINQ